MIKDNWEIVGDISFPIQNTASCQSIEMACLKKGKQYMRVDVEFLGCSCQGYDCTCTIVYYCALNFKLSLHAC